MNSRVAHPDDRGMNSIDPSSGARLADDDRRFGRLRTQALGCSIGQVLDLSGGGMRVRTIRDAALVQGTTLGVVLYGGDLPDTRVDARIVWARNTGWRAREVGLSFLAMPEATRSGLSEIVRRLMTSDPVAMQRAA